jgi:hypothetical protein
VTTPRLIAWCDSYPQRRASSGRVYLAPIVKNDSSMRGLPAAMQAAGLVRDRGRPGEL